MRINEKKLIKIGVTGTTGKTTTTHMIRDMLLKVGISCGLIGSIGIKYEDKVIHTDNTTPESYEVFKAFKEMLDNGITHVVMECSSQAYKLNRLAGIIFDIGVLTNMTSDHIGPKEHDNYLVVFDITSRIDWMKALKKFFIHLSIYILIAGLIFGTLYIF